jgi:predicted ester cyclase
MQCSSLAEVLGTRTYANPTLSPKTDRTSHKAFLAIFGSPRGTSLKLNLDELQDFAVRYTAAWCSQDAARVASFFSPNGSLCVNDSAPAIGRRAIQEVAQSFMTAFPDLQVILDRVVTERDRIDYQWTLVGTNTGPSGTGKPVRINGVERWNFGEDALIASSVGRFDAADYQRQLDLGV